ncbi:MAG: hypothetical protein RI996_304 [Candidatus Parcubacteria bacterium]|jgi:hypothetical protein
MGTLSRHKKEKKEAEKFYKSVKELRCPYFSNPVNFTSDGFHHLQFSNGSERTKDEQLLKFSLLKDAVDIIKKSGTIQEYRKQWGVVSRKKKNGEQPMKEIEYFGLTAITGTTTKRKIKVILRKIGTGNVIFWSVMFGDRRNKDTYHLANPEIDNS